MFTLAKSNKKVNIRNSIKINSSILDGNADVFSPVCDPKIEMLEDVGIIAVEVCLVKTLADSPTQ